MTLVVGCKSQEWKGAGEPAGKLLEEKWMSAGASGFFKFGCREIPINYLPSL